MVPDATTLSRTVIERFGGRSIILYGSRSSGRHRTDSDIDLVLLHDGDGEERRTLKHAGLPVDLSIYGLGRIAALPPGTLRYFAGGRLFHGDADAASAFLAAADRAAEDGPHPLTSEKAHVWRVWAEKTAARIAQPGDPAAALYRRGWLAQRLYELHFRLRGRWDPKIDEGFAAMRRDDPGLLALFEAAQTLPPGPALLEAQRALIGRVFAEEPPAP